MKWECINYFYDSFKKSGRRERARERERERERSNPLIDKLEEVETNDFNQLEVDKDTQSEAWIYVVKRLGRLNEGEQAKQLQWLPRSW